VYCWFFKQHMYVGVTFLYVTVFSSNICMVAIYLFMLHNKHTCFIVVPHICCSQHPTPCTCFFFGVLYVWTHVITQARYPSSQSHNGIIQVLRLGIMIMFEPCHHRETTHHSEPWIWGCITTWSTGVGSGPHLTAAHSSRQDMCQDALYSKTYHTNHVRHVVSIYVCPLFRCKTMHAAKYVQKKISKPVWRRWNAPLYHM